MHKYYFAKNDQRYGPFTLQELKQYQIMADTLVWRKGMPQWLPAAEVREVWGYLQTPAPTSASRPLMAKQLQNQEPALSTSKASSAPEEEKKPLLDDSTKGILFMASMIIAYEFNLFGFGDFIDGLF